MDIEVLNNGVKLVGEALVPGASLLFEKQIGSGLLLTTLGVSRRRRVRIRIRAAWLRAGALFSFSQSLQPEPPAAKTNGNGQAAANAMSAAAERIGIAARDRISDRVVAS